MALDLSGLPDKDQSSGLDLTGLPDSNENTLSGTYRLVNKPSDEYAKIKTLSTATGLPEPVVENNIQAAEMKAAEPDWGNVSPNLKGVLSNDVELFKVAKDDTENLSTIERSFKALGAGAVQATLGVSKSIHETPETIARGSEYLSESLESLTGLPKAFDPIRAIQYTAEYFARGKIPGTGIQTGGMTDIGQRIGEAQNILTEQSETFGRINEKAQKADEAFGELLSGNAAPIAEVLTDPEAWAGFIGQAAPSLYTAYKSGGSIPFMAWLEGMEASSNALEFEQRTGQKITPQQFSQAVAQTAIVNSLLEKYGLDKVIGEAGKGVLSSTIKGFFAEGGTELFQQLNSNVAAYVSYNPEQSMTEGVLGSFMGGAGTGAPGGAMSAIGRRVAKQTAASESAEKNAEAIATITEAAKNSKLRQRDKAAFSNVIDQMLGDEAEDIYISGEDAIAFFQSDPEAIEEIAKNVPELEKSINEALETGGDVVISAKDYVTYFSEYHDALADKIRVGAEGTSIQDAAKWKDGDTAEFKEEADRILKERESDTAAERVKQSIMDEITATGRFTGDVADKYAALHGAFAKAMSERLGITPEEVYDRYGLRVRVPPPAADLTPPPSEVAAAGGTLFQHDQAASGFANMTREEFLGNPSIVGASDAAKLIPRDLNEGTQAEPFLGGRYTVVVGESGAAVYDGSKVIASYNLGRNLVVDKKYRRKGIAEELVYVWRTRYPGKAVAETRTKASQKIQEKVWDRIQREISSAKTAELAQSPIKKEPAITTPISTAVNPTEAWAEHHKNQAKEDGLTPDQAKAVEPTPDTDQLTGLFTDIELLSALERARESGKPFIYVESDTFNVGGMNKALGANVRTDAVLKQMGQAYSSQFPGMPVFRRGVGRFAAIVPADFGVKEALTKASEAVGSISRQNELEDIEAPKVAGARGIGLYSGQIAISPGMDTGETIGLAQAQIEAAMPKGVEDVNREQAFEAWSAKASGQTGGIAARVANQNREGGPNVGQVEGSIGAEALERVAAKAVPSEPSPISPDVVRASEFEKTVKQANIPPDKAQKYKPVTHTDPLTGWFTARDLKPTLYRAQQWVEETGGEAVYAVVDISNLGGMTSALGREIADVILRNMAHSTGDQAIGIEGAKTVPFRHGGDEFGFVITGANIESARAAMVKAAADVSGYVHAIGIQDLPHAKEPNNVARRGSGIYVGVQSIGGVDVSIDDVIDAADARVEVNKKRPLAKPVPVPVRGETTVLRQEDYRGAHVAPGPEDARLDDVTKGGDIYPDDIYSANGLRYYGTGQDKADRESMGVIQSVRGKPNATVTIYRAVPHTKTSAELFDEIDKQMAAYLKRGTLPEGIEDGSAWYDSAWETREELRNMVDDPGIAITEINTGDWVTLSKTYAKEHGESSLNGEYKIITKKVKAKELFTNGDSINEFGYWKDGKISDEAYYQPGARGSIEFPTDISKMPSVITLFENADLSTFTHESAHFFFEVMTHIASQENAPQQIVDDFNVLLDWYGVKDMEEWKSLDGDSRRDHHEKFARGFEAYLFEGKAPSVELQSIFQRFRSWLISVYKSIRALDVELTDEVRGAFDRLLATEEEIKAAEVANGYKPLFESIEQARMTKSEWDAYQNSDKQAAADAQSDLDTRSLRDMKWLSGAKSRALKQLQREGAAKRAIVKAEVTEDLNNEPVYQATKFFKTGETVGPDGEEIKVLQGNKLNKEQVLALFPPEELAAVDLKKLKGMTSIDGGMDIDLAGQMFGFSNGDQLIKAILAAPALKEAIEQRTDEVVLERYGDISDPVALENAANEAVHSEARGRFIASEMRALNRQLGSKAEIVKAAKEYAAEKIAVKKVRDARLPGKYRSAEARAARDAETALKNDDIVKAAQYKRAQVLNYYMGRAAIDAATEIDKTVTYLKKFERKSVRSKLRGDMVDQLDSLLARFDLRKAPPKEGDREPLSAWVESEAERLDAIVPDLDPIATNEGYRKHYKDLTLDELRGLKDTVKQLEHMARREERMYQERRALGFEQEKEAILNELSEAHPEAFDYEGTPKQYRKDRLPLAKELRNKFRNKFDAEFVNMENILDIMTLGKGNQIFDSLFNRMSEAADAQTKMMKDLAKFLDPYTKAYTRKERLAFSMAASRVFVPEVGEYFTRDKRIAVAMFYGSLDGRQRLMDGNGYTDHQIKAIMKTLTDKDLDFINALWEMSDEKIWPELKALDERTKGVPAKKIDPAPFTINGREMRGGYVPLVYDGDLSTRSFDLNTDNAIADMRGGGATQASTRQSASKQRLQEVKRPLDLSLSAITYKINETVHDITHREAVTDTYRLLKSNRISNAIRTIAGPDVYKALLTKVREVAVSPTVPRGVTEKALWYLRRNTMINMMGASFNTVAINILGASPSIRRVGPARFIKALNKFASTDGVKRYKWLIEKSPYMRERIDGFDRDLSTEVNRFTGKAGITPSMGVWFAGLSIMDRMITLPTWVAAYEQSMEDSGNNEELSIKYADRIVRQTQGSGRAIDLAKVSGGVGPAGEFKRIITMFYNFFSAQLGMMVRSKRLAEKEWSEGKRAKAAMEFTLTTLATIVIPATLEAIARGNCGDDPDAEDYMFCSVRASALFTASMFPLVRDMVPFAWHQFDPDTPAFGVRISPIESAMETMARAPKSAVDAVGGDATESDVRTIIRGLGYTFGLPGFQASRTLEGYQAFMDGETDNPAVMLTGAPR